MQCSVTTLQELNHVTCISVHANFNLNGTAKFAEQLSFGLAMSFCFLVQIFTKITKKGPVTLEHVLISS